MLSVCAIMFPLNNKPNTPAMTHYPEATVLMQIPEDILNLLTCNTREPFPAVRTPRAVRTWLEDNRADIINPAAWLLEDMLTEAELARVLIAPSTGVLQ